MRRRIGLVVSDNPEGREWLYQQLVNAMELYLHAPIDSWTRAASASALINMFIPAYAGMPRDWRSSQHAQLRQLDPNIGPRELSLRSLQTRLRRDLKGSRLYAHFRRTRDYGESNDD